MPGPVLTGLVLARAEVDRSAHLRSDAAWLDAAWADPHTRVLVVEHGRAICAIDDRQARLCFVPPAQAPDGVRFLLGIDDDGVAYFGVAGPLPDLREPEEDGVRPVPLREKQARCCRTGTLA